MNYYQFHIADFTLHTAHLTLVEEAVYRRLLDYCYDTEAPIPEETKPVIRRLRLQGYEETVSEILSEFFVLEADGWHNRRVDSEIQAYREKAERAKANGKKGGRPKKNNKLNPEKPKETKPVISGNQEETNEKANQEPRTINQEPLVNGSPSAPVGDTPPPDKPKKSRFAPPSVEQVRAYCLERGNSVDPQKFVDHYEASGWVRGKSKVKDWKACVRTWEGNQKGNHHENIQPGTGKLQQYHDQINAAAARAASRADAAGPVEAHGSAVRPQVVIPASADGR